ncbi:MAG: HlyD family secretion protein, partial [Hyphomicrobium sp.]
MSNQLQASQVKWKRLRKLLLTVLFISGAGGFAVYALAGGSLMLDADGLVTRQTVAVASPWPDARIREISVHPGDWVEAGQKIAVVDSAAMSRSLADLAAEQARVTGRVAQLEARREVVKALLPMAKVAAEDTNAYMSTLQKANSNGLALTRSLQQMSTAQVQAMDKVLSLEAEKTSLETEITANQGALQQVSGAYADLQRTYGSGVLTAPASGYVGSHVGMVGEVLSAGTTPVANIYSGTSYVLAYIPENYLFDVDKGQKVLIKGRGRTATGYIERVLPVTDALPPEFQLPNRVRGRGQLVRVELSQPKDFALDEKVRLTSCYTDKCGLGVSQTIEAAIPEFLRGGNHWGAKAERQRPATPAGQEPQPAAPSTAPVVSVDQPGTTASTTGSGAETVGPETLQMRGESTPGIPEPTQPQA